MSQNRHLRKSCLTMTFRAITIILVLFTSTAWAELANSDEMDMVCRNWVNHIVEQTGDWAGATRPEIIETRDIYEDGMLLGRYYALSSGGNIIVPVLKEMPPVKAYSEEYYLDIDEPDGFAKLIREVLKERMDLFIELYGSLDVVQDSKEPIFPTNNRTLWNRYAVPEADYARRAADKSEEQDLISGGPLLTTAWHQGAPYNDYCPTGYDNDICVVGCVATAAAQIMWYHQWPSAGQGDKTYWWNGDDSCDDTPVNAQYLSADFSDDYEYTVTSHNLAELCYEVGVAFEMDYGACGSGAYTSDAVVVFPTYFRYLGNASRIWRYNFSALDWYNQVKTQIDNYRPIQYRIYGHSIVCDGYRDTYGTEELHFNYGWGGSYNAWYVIDGLHCPWEGCSPSEEFMIINITPIKALLALGDQTFNDNIVGDNDGIPEAGETVDVIVAIDNKGVEDVTDVSALFWIEDAGITITNNSASYGSITAGGSADNSSSPFRIEIPSGYITRVDSFFVEITYDGGSIVDTLSFEATIGETTILLIDDDNNGVIETFYTECLNNMRVPYDVWLYSYYQPPDSEYMSDYDMVIWFTGDYRSDIISTQEIEVIKQYLNGGGTLWLSGQGIAAELASDDLDLLNNYLMSSYESTYMAPLLTTATSSQILLAGDSLAIQGSGGASNQTDTDIISTAGSGNAELAYYGSPSSYCAVSYIGTYKSFFCGFGCEAVIQGSDRWMSRDTLFQRVFEFFEMDHPNSAPFLSDLTTDGPDSMHVLNNTPEIIWTYNDGSGNPQQMYQIQVGSDTEWETIELWESGVVSSSASQVTYAGDPLLDGVIYQYRIRVHNGSFWSDWYSSQFRLNSVPGTPTVLAPDNLAGVSTATPSLTVTNIDDPDNDNMHYDYEVYQDVGLISLITSVTSISEGGSATSWTVDVALNDDQIYYWRTRADDGFETGEWSEAANFWVNSENEAPLAFDLLEPANSSFLTDQSVSLVWQPSEPSDLFDEPTYRLYCSFESDFTPTEIYQYNLTDTVYNIDGTLENGHTYYWKVVAVDNYGAMTTCNETFIFSTIAMGDANADGTVNIADASYIVNAIFFGGTQPDPEEIADANCDGAMNITDASYLINFIFFGGGPLGCN